MARATPAIYFIRSQLNVGVGPPLVSARLKSTRTEVRFAAGRPYGRHSRIWRLWLTKSEVYFSGRTSAGVYKVSLHSQRDNSVPPAYQLSLTSEFASDLVATHELPKGTRHMAKWTRQGPDSLGRYFAVKLLLPEAGFALGSVPPTKLITWLGEPQQGSTIELRFLFAPKEAAEARRHGDGAKVVEWTLTNGDILLMLAYNRPLSGQEKASIADFKERALSEPPTWQSGEIDRTSPDVGLLLHGLDHQGVYTLIDLSLAA